MSSCFVEAKPPTVATSLLPVVRNLPGAKRQPRFLRHTSRFLILGIGRNVIDLLYFPSLFIDFLILGRLQCLKNPMKKGILHPLKKLLALVGMVALIALGACTSTSSPTDFNSLIDSLEDTGAVVQPTGDISQPFLAVSGQVIKVDNSDVQVFEYSGTTAANADADLVSPDGSSVGTTMISWVATPHFYKSGKLIVIYVGDNQAVISTLQEVLGSQFAGG